MNETKRMLEALKRCMRARAMTYRGLGRALGLSESSVKRLFADQSFTLSRLERVCSALDMSVADLSKMAAGGREVRTQAQAYGLTLEQERMLATNPSLLACFYLLLNGRSVEQTERRLGLTARTMRTLLSRLATARLLDVDAKRNVQLHATLPIAWRPDGPVRRLYERQVRAEFLQGSFGAGNEALSFHSAELSPASVRILLRKIERLAADFADLAALDVHVSPREKTSVALLLACRPWVFSMFSAYRARAT
ncbi:MAG TPA: helix-turn-helix transcriptional regulator [Steroidobacteraceae bacterium]|jgi:DNA-binding Xre family transcriptional regulator